MRHGGRCLSTRVLGGWCGGGPTSGVTPSDDRTLEPKPMIHSPWPSDERPRGVPSRIRVRSPLVVIPGESGRSRTRGSQRLRRPRPGHWRVSVLSAAVIEACSVAVDSAPLTVGCWNWSQVIWGRPGAWLGVFLQVILSNWSARRSPSAPPLAGPCIANRPAAARVRRRQR